MFEMKHDYTRFVERECSYVDDARIQYFACWKKRARASPLPSDELFRHAYLNASSIQQQRRAYSPFHLSFWRTELVHTEAWEKKKQRSRHPHEVPGEKPQLFHSLDSTRFLPTNIYHDDILSSIDAKNAKRSIAFYENRTHI
jgi:hypothetical protein